MFKRIHRRNVAALVAVGVACIVGASAYAFTASNTLPSTAAAEAGGGTVAVSGYTVSNLAYTFSADGTSVSAVGFDLDSAANDVKVALTSGTPVHGDWVDCGASGGSTPWAVTCSFGTPIANGSADNLAVVAVGSGTATIAP